MTIDPRTGSRPASTRSSQPPERSRMHSFMANLHCTKALDWQGIGKLARKLGEALRRGPLTCDSVAPPTGFEPVSPP